MGNDMDCVIISTSCLSRTHKIVVFFVGLWAFFLGGGYVHEGSTYSFNSMCQVKSYVPPFSFLGWFDSYYSANLVANENLQIHVHF